MLANLFVNREPCAIGLDLDAEMEAESRDLLHRLGLNVDVHAPVGRLSIGERQLVELARVLLEEPQLLILDEPNSALNERETERLFAVLRSLRSAASPCSTSRTGWRKCSRSPTGSPSRATVATF